SLNSSEISGCGAAGAGEGVGEGPVVGGAVTDGVDAPGAGDGAGSRRGACAATTREISAGLRPLGTGGAAIGDPVPSVTSRESPSSRTEYGTRDFSSRTTRATSLRNWLPRICTRGPVAMTSGVLRQP